jgi:hypothetical protein
MAIEIVIDTICMVVIVLSIHKSSSGLRTLTRASIGFASGVVFCIIEGSSYGDAKIYTVCGLVWACIAVHLNSEQRPALRVVAARKQSPRHFEQLAS